MGRRVSFTQPTYKKYLNTDWNWRYRSSSPCNCYNTSLYLSIMSRLCQLREVAFVNCEINHSRYLGLVLYSIHNVFHICWSTYYDSWQLYIILCCACNNGFLCCSDWKENESLSGWFIGRLVTEFLRVQFEREREGQIPRETDIYRCKERAREKQTHRARERNESLI